MNITAINYFEDYFINNKSNIVYNKFILFKATLKDSWMTYNTFNQITLINVW